MRCSIEVLQELMQQNAHVPGLFEVRDAITSTQCLRCGCWMCITVDANGGPGGALVKTVCRPNPQSSVSTAPIEAGRDSVAEHSRGLLALAR